MISLYITSTDGPALDIARETYLECIAEYLDRVGGAPDELTAQYVDTEAEATRTRN